MYDRPENGTTSGATDGTRTSHDRPAPTAEQVSIDKPRERSRRPIIAVAMMVIAVAAYFAGSRVWNYLASYESTDDAQIQGYIDPVSARINGTVIRVAVDDNQRVKAGALLVLLDPRDYQVAVEQARANLTQAEAQVNVARQNYVAAQAQLREAEASDARSQHDEQRYRALIDEHVASQAQYDQYVSAARVSAATVAADRAAIGAAERTIASREADVLAARAVLDQALLNLGYTEIRAPADGIVGKRTVQLGQRVEPGEQLMALTQIDRFWVTANFKETQLARMRAGQPVTIYVDAYSSRFKGHVESMPGASGAMYSLLPPENATGNYVKIVQRLPVRIRFDDGQPGIELLRPGMSVEPTVWLR
jgi:membrane fusion protein (multidrug efflux system)